MRYEQQVIERAKDARKRLFGSAPNVVRLAPLPVEPEPEPEPEPIDKDAKIRSLELRIAELEAQEAIRDPQGGRKLAKAVAKAHGISFKEMISVRRQKGLCRARQQAMWELREHTDLSLPQIGKLLGNRDHTTVLHGCRAHAARMARGEA